MHHDIKMLCMGSILFSFCVALRGMDLTKAPHEVIHLIGHMLSNQEIPHDYNNYALKNETHTEQTLDLFKKYEKNVTEDYINLMSACKYTYTLLNYKNRLPIHLSWDVFIKSMHEYTLNEEGLLKMTSHHSIKTEKCSFEFFSFGKYIRWKLTCDFFQRSSRKAISKNDVLKRSFIDREAPLWDILNFAKKHSVVQAVYVYSFNHIFDDNNNKYIQFICIGSFDWLKKGVPLIFVEKYFLDA